MKIRNGFVSNSSSSSFVMIGNDGEHKKPNYHEEFDPKGQRCIRIPQTFGGETEFGWQVEEYYDFPEKLNWATLMAKKEESRWKMLKKVLKEDFNVEAVYDCLNWYDEDDDNSNSFYTRSENGYIDHQSVDEDAAAMFKDTTELRDWLYGSKSFIHNDNDNY
jgi:hypothetical protein